MPQTLPRPTSDAIPVGLAVLALMALVFLVFSPGIDGPFVFDDYSNILREPAMQALRLHQGSLTDALNAGRSGPIGRPLSVATLALQVEHYGFVPRPFKLFNIGVHAVNTALCYLLVRLLLAQPGAPLRLAAHAKTVALFTAAAWGLHPLTLTAVLYVVQRMTSLAALGVLAALLCAAKGRLALARGAPAWPWLWLGFPVFAVAAVLAKESGVLVLAYLLVLELTVLSPAPLPVPAQAVWRRFVGTFAWVPLLAALLASPYLVTHFAAGYDRREFSLFERLLTEARVIWLYLRLLVLPDPHLLGLYHDDIVLSRDWLVPWTNLPALAGLLALFTAAIVVRRRHPWFALAVLFFLASQLIESTVVPLEIAHEHRVYLGILGPVVAATAGLHDLLERRRIRWRLALLALPVLVLSLSTWQRAVDWATPLRFALIEAEHHPASVRARYDVATVYAELGEGASDPAERARLFATAREAALQSIALAPGDAEPRIGLLVISGLAGDAPPSEVIAALRQILRNDPRTDEMASELVGLAGCAADGSCGLSRALWQDLCAVLGSNAHLTGSARRGVDDALNMLRRAPDAALAERASKPSRPGRQP